jgi:outer membrane protein
MKKTFLMVLVLIFVGTITANAQGKYGHINSQEVMKQMPGIDSLRIKMENYQMQMQEMYQSMMDEYQTKVDYLNQNAGILTSAVRKVKEDEINALKNRIVSFQTDVQADIEEQQVKLLKPYQDALQKAIDDVCKEKGFTYIFDTQILLYSGGEDITPYVKAKLGIK